MHIQARLLMNTIFREYGIHILNHTYICAQEKNYALRHLGFFDHVGINTLNVGREGPQCLTTAAA